MSPAFDKETAATTAKSLFGALIALGAGFIFMFCGLVAVTASNQTLEGDPLPRRAVSGLRNDLLSSVPGTVRVSAEQNILTFQRYSDSGPQVEIIYTVDPSSGEVSRSIDGETRRVANLSKARFEHTAGEVRLIWASTTGEKRASWALSRWVRQAL